MAACLPVDAGGQIPGLGRAVVVDRTALDDSPDVIAIRQRIRQPTQHHNANARTKHRPLCAVIKGMAGAVRRQDLALLEHIAARMGQFDGHAPGQSHVALAIQQGLRGQMGGHERGGTGGLHVDRRPLEVEDMAQPRAQEILVVAGMAQEKHPRLRDQIGVGTDVEVEIAAHPAAGIDTDRAVERLGHVPGVFQRLPRGLKELAVLGVHDRGFLGGKAKEFSVEPLEPLQSRGKGHIVRAGSDRGRLASGSQLLGRQTTDRRHTIAQVLPIGIDRRRPRQMRGHANDGDIARVNWR
jgi:hypothetical protein